MIKKSSHSSCIINVDVYWIVSLKYIVWKQCGLPSDIHFKMRYRSRVISHMKSGLIHSLRTPAYHFHILNTWPVSSKPLIGAWDHETIVCYSPLISTYCLIKQKEHSWFANKLKAGVRHWHCCAAGKTKSVLFIRRHFDRWTPVFAQRTLRFLVVAVIVIGSFVSKSLIHVMLLALVNMLRFWKLDLKSIVFNDHHWTPV